MEIYEPMLAKSGSKDILERKNLVGYVFEPKFEGIRVLIYKQADNIAIFNKRKRDIIARYPEFLDLDAYINAESCVLDGQLVVLNEQGNPDAKLLQTRELLGNHSKIKAASRKNPATIFVFDILELEEKSLVSELLRNRKVILKDLIKKGPNLILCPYTLHGKDLWKQVLEQEIEGMMSKEINSKYESGKKNWSWLKIPNMNIAEAAVIGFTRTNDKINSLILASYDKNMQLFKYVGRLNIKDDKNFDKKTIAFLSKIIKEITIKQSILGEDEQKKLCQEIKWLKPELVARIKFNQIESHEVKDISFLRFVFDKEPFDCVFEKI